jgi:hypothetical protein
VARCGPVRTVPSPAASAQVKRDSRESGGVRQASLVQQLTNPATRWRQVTTASWYAGYDQWRAITSRAALWYHPSKSVQIHRIIVENGMGEFDSQDLMCTNLVADTVEIPGWFVQRWPVEVTCVELR